MNKYTLRFFNQSLEEQFFTVQLGSYRGKIHTYFLCIIFLFSSLQLVQKMTDEKNIEFIIWNAADLFLIIIFSLIALKFPHYIKFLVFMENFILISQQIQVALYDIYTYEGYFDLLSLTEIQMQVLLIQSFDVSTAQIFLSIVSKVSLALILMKKVSYIALIQSALSASFIILSIYFTKQCMRQLFLLQLKDNQWQQQLPSIISKPYFQITYNEFTMQFKTDLDNQVERFPGYSNELCNGCNLRSFLRLKMCNSNISLERHLLDCFQNKENEGKLNYDINVTYNDAKYTIRICHFNVERFLCFVILENTKLCSEMTYRTNLIKRIKKQLYGSITSESKSIHQTFYKMGLFTMLYFNNKEKGEVNIFYLIQRVSKQFNFLQIKVGYKGQHEQFNVSIYTKKMIIFMIQVFNIFTKMSELNREWKPPSIKVFHFDQKIMIQFNVFERNFFLEEFNNNSLIMSVEKLLFFRHMDNRLLLIIDKLQSNSKGKKYL